jgi:predicted transcriptional regulator
MKPVTKKPLPTETQPAHPVQPKPLPSPHSGWTFLSNHAHVLVCIARNPRIRLREVAVLVGITERGVQKIVSELADAGVIERTREGRRSRYTVRRDEPLRHPIEARCSVGDLLDATAHL